MISKKMLFLSITLIFVVTGCYQNYEVFGYKTDEVQFEWGVIGAKLIGKKIKNGRTTQKKSPYELFIWAHPNAIDYNAIKITLVELKYSESNRIITLDQKIVEGSFKKEGKKYSAYLSFPNIELKHNDIELYLKFEIEKNDNMIEYSSKLNFKKDYQKFRRIIGV